jgi:hypothetical protein
VLYIFKLKLNYIAETEQIIFDLVVKVFPKVVKVTMVWYCILNAVTQAVPNASAPSPFTKLLDHPQ